MVNKKWTAVLALLISIILIAALAVPAFAAEKGNGNRRLAKAATDPNTGYFDGNRIFSYMVNNGSIVTQTVTANAGMYWPSRAGLKTINYASGVWVAGKVNGEPVTACAEYASEWAPGKVLADGTPDNKDDAKYRLYKINKADQLNPASNPDWMNWPVDQGAPWIDANGNGVYEPLAGDMPDMIGDQMIWYVMNDLNIGKHANLFQSQPIGLECKVTIWGYNRPDEFGDMMFAKFQLYKRTPGDVLDCYLGVWADVDLGDGNDDFVGCDTTLSLGYTYNDGPDGVYGDAAPALGYDFFQGAIVASAGDTAKAFGKRIPGYMNLGMSAFVKYINLQGSLFSDPETAQDCWNYMSGLTKAGARYVDPTTGQEVFPVKYGSGDPVTNTGWIDALDHVSGDRRQLISCGPFTLASGDSQEVVTANIIGQGTDALSSITRLKIADTKAQTAYDLDFALPKSPTPPIVKAQGLDGKIVLTWDGAAEAYEAIDQVDVDADGNPTTYTFQGYNVYQLESDRGGAIKKIATIDLSDLVTDIKDWEFVGSLGETVEHVVQSGKDTGLRRYYSLVADPLRGGVPLVNNRPYYLAVTAYGYNPLGIPKTLESPKMITIVYPQQPFGERINAQIQDSLAITHTGPSQGSVTAFVVNPAKVTGHDYQVVFHNDMWDVKDATTGQIVLADQTNQSGDGAYDVVDGMVVEVTGPAPGINWNMQDPAMTPAGYEDYCWGWGFDGTRWVGGYDLSGSYANTGLLGGLVTGIDFWGVYASRYVDIKLEFKVDPGPDSSNWQKAYVIRRDKGYALEGLGWFPGKLWNVQVDPPQQLNLAFIEDNRLVPANNQWDMGWQADSSNYAHAGAQGNREYIWMLDSPFDVNNPDLLAADWYDGSTIGLMYAIYPIPRGTRPYLQGDWNLTVYAAKPNSDTDVFAFSTNGKGAQASDAYSMEDVKKINVFPNPYFGANVEEIRALDHFVRFTHLPPTATIRIYTLAGELVRTLNHSNQTQFETWNLQNMASIPVASGMYIAHVDCGKLGEKVLKLALIMAEERLRQY
jgi:hypothetical protein